MIAPPLGLFWRAGWINPADARELDHFSPLVDVLGDKPAELRGLHCRRQKAEIDD
jgi:hypothetical protein